MATEANKRVLVYIQKTGSADSPIPAKFTQSIVDYFGFLENEGSASVDLRDNKLVVTDDSCKTRVKIKRPQFCPIHNLKPSDISDIPEEIINRGVDVGAAVILQTGDNKILLTRRAGHLRTFPGVWVPPGGHIEENETIVDAGFRELQEETGLAISQEDCQDGNVPVIALWESTFPPKLNIGLPKRHHVVVYILAKLLPSMTSEDLQKRLSLDPEEVGASMWVDRLLVEAITTGRADSELPEKGHAVIPSEIKATVINDQKQQLQVNLPTAPLFKTSTDKLNVERVSTGTKFVLEEWLKLPQPVQQNE